jgi:hypothetical protein
MSRPRACRAASGKGATPSWSGYAADDDGRTLIPLNMSEPILIARHRDVQDLVADLLAHHRVDDAVVGLGPVPHDLERLPVSTTARARRRLGRATLRTTTAAP